MTPEGLVLELRSIDDGHRCLASRGDQPTLNPTWLFVGIIFCGDRKRQPLFQCKIFPFFDSRKFGSCGYYGGVGKLPAIERILWQITHSRSQSKLTSDASTIVTRFKLLTKDITITQDIVAFFKFSKENISI
jgi:hypothetical protein